MSFLHKNTVPTSAEPPRQLDNLTPEAALLFARGLATDFLTGEGILTNPSAGRAADIAWNAIGPHRHGLIDDQDTPLGKGESGFADEDRRQLEKGLGALAVQDPEAQAMIADIARQYALTPRRPLFASRLRRRVEREITTSKPPEVDIDTWLKGVDRQPWDVLNPTSEIARNYGPKTSEDAVDPHALTPVPDKSV